MRILFSLSVKKQASSRANMAAVITYALPTMQLVCHLVATGPSNTNGVTLGAIIQPPPTTPATPPGLPKGYVAYPDFGAAYKVHNELVSWEVAKDRCAREGAYLATIDSNEKIQVVRNQDPSRNLTHVGFYLPNRGSTTWYSVYNDLPIGRSLPWASSEPSGDGLYAAIKYGLGGLGKYTAVAPGDYVCQIDYPARNRLPVDITPN